MRHFIPLGVIDPIPLRLQLERNPQLWNQHNDRTTRDVTAHAAVSDIWVRYRPLDQLTAPASYNEPFAEFVWYPAYHALPDLRPLVMSLMHRVGGTALGGVLITKIPPGGKVLPHSDRGTWHAEYFNTKVYTVLKANPLSVNHTEDESLVMREGENWIFDNLKLHAVDNAGDDDRITLITAIRCD